MASLGRLGRLRRGGDGRWGGDGAVQWRVVLGHEQARRRKPEKLRSLDPRPVVRSQVGGQVRGLAGDLYWYGDSGGYDA